MTRTECRTAALTLQAVSSRQAPLPAGMGGGHSAASPVLVSRRQPKMITVFELGFVFIVCGL